MTGEVLLQRALRLHLASAKEAPFGTLEHVNYDEEIHAGKAVAAEAIVHDTRASLLVFGYPGNGKRVFAQRLSNELWPLGFHSIWLDIAAMTPLDEELVLTGMTAIDRVLSSETYRPLVVVLENLDALATGQKEDGAVSAVKTFLKTCAAPTNPTKLVVIATAQFPDKAARELSALGSFRSLYFPWPDPTRIERFLSELHVPRAGEVAARLDQLATEAGVRYTAASLIRGTLMATRTTGDLSELDVEDIVKVISTFCTPSLEEEVDEYLSDNGHFIADADHDLKEISEAFPDPREAISASLH